MLIDIEWKEYFTRLGIYTGLLGSMVLFNANKSDMVSNIEKQIDKDRILNNQSQIEYVMTINGPEPTQILKSTIDYQHYIDKQIKPIADSVLVFFNKSLDDLLLGKQKSIFDY